MPSTGVIKIRTGKFAGPIVEDSDQLTGGEARFQELLE
jgi:hypothetical protein